MNTTDRMRRIQLWFLLAPGLVACGFAAAREAEPAEDPVREVHDRFEAFEGPVREVPIEEWDNYFLEAPFSVAFQDGGFEIASDRFHDRIEYFLNSPESDGVSFDFKLHQVWTVASRLALVRGDIQTKAGPRRQVRPFAEMLVKKDGAWRTVASYVGSPEEGSGVADRRSGGQDLTACACEPCRTCSSGR